MRSSHPRLSYAVHVDRLDVDLLSLTAGRRAGVSIHLEGVCNVRVPPDDCADIGSALTFSGAIGRTAIQGLITYYPHWPGMSQDDFISIAMAFRRRLDEAITSCVSAQSRTRSFDKSMAAQCIADALMGVAVAPTAHQTHANVPRSVAVVSSIGFADVLTHGLHLRAVYDFQTRAGLGVSILVIVQP